MSHNQHFVVYFGSQFKAQFIMAGKSWWQEHEAAGDIVYSQGAEKGRCRCLAGPLFIQSRIHGGVTQSGRSSQPSWKHPPTQRYTQRCFQGDSTFSHKYEQCFKYRLSCGSPRHTGDLLSSPGCSWILRPSCLLTPKWWIVGMAALPVSNASFANDCCRAKLPILKPLCFLCK